MRRSEGARRELVRSPCYHSILLIDRKLTPLFSHAERSAFSALAIDADLSTLEEILTDLRHRSVSRVDYGPSESITEAARALANTRTACQMCLHRSDALIRSSVVSVARADVYTLGLASRGQMELTAVVGYVARRLELISNGELQLAQYAWDVATCVMGARHELFSELPNPIGIMSCVDVTDKFLAKALHPKEGLKGRFRDAYDWLRNVSPEFCV